MLFILDRDGVINADPHGYINCPTRWHAIDGSLEAIAQLTKAGHKVAVCSNQSGVGRGIITPEQLTAIHSKMQQQINAAGGNLCGIYICPHHPDENCNCRKPKPTLFQQIISAHSNPQEEIWAIGDSIGDIRAGLSSACNTAMVLTGNGQKHQAMLDPNASTLIFNDLSHAIQHISTLR